MNGKLNKRKSERLELDKIHNEIAEILETLDHDTSEANFDLLDSKYKESGAIRREWFNSPTVKDNTIIDF